MSLGISVQIKDEVMFVELIGELDQSQTDKVRLKLKTNLAGYDVKHIVWNFKRLTFMDSSGIGVILGRYNDIKKLGGRMFALGMNPTISKLFYLSGLHQIITVIDDEATIENQLSEVI